MGEPPTPPIRRPPPPDSDFPRPEPILDAERSLRQELEARFHHIRDLETRSPTPLPQLKAPSVHPAHKAREAQGAYKRELGGAYQDLLATANELGELLRRVRQNRRPPA